MGLARLEYPSARRLRIVVGQLLAVIDQSWIFGRFECHQLARWSGYLDILFVRNPVIHLQMWIHAHDFCSITISCFIWRRFNGPPLPRARWSLGRFGLPINIAALCFLLPLWFFAFWPLATPVTPTNMNWSSAMFGGLLIIAMIYYFVKARHEYQGPVAYIKRM
ncbi:hypothetical protein LTR78_003332 [Recurvomyces mirabilis]|uniref:Uncharacterized protein n=1 Tax=Recurvomyces mirabilis TaxID=574656 RepID=A0AAE0WSA8_9PEZI|nr:hypothetical protein LTR78_003332 [Recurvomyces mirabilis]